MKLYECPCGVTYDASTTKQILRHQAAKRHRDWMHWRR